MMRSTFAVPLVLAIASLVGLVAALTGDGWRNALSWLGLGLPVVAIAWGWRGRRRYRIASVT